MLATLMGGQVGVNSEEGKGAEFWFTYKNNDAGFTKPSTEEQLWPRVGVPLVLVGFDDVAVQHFYRLWRHQFSAIHFIDKATNIDNIDSIAADQKLVTLCTDVGFSWIKDSALVERNRNQIYLLTKNAVQAEELRRSNIPAHVLEDGLPLELIRQFGSESEAMPMQGKSLDTLDLTGFHILVAEDNPVNQIVIQGILKRFDARVTIVPDGEKAVIHFKENHRRIDLILMDIEMPKLNGFNATERVRSFEKTLKLEATPVYGLSAHALDQYKVQAEKVGMDGFITKPISIDEISAALARFNVAKRKQSLSLCESQTTHPNPILIH
jgi:CheY-like chemotaxis protein